MPTLTATVTSTTELILAPKIKRKLLTELKAYAELKAQRDAIDAALDSHKATIEGLREGTDETSISLEGFKVTRISPTRSILDKKKLLAEGVTMGQIQNATVTKATKPYTKVTLPNEVEVVYANE